MFVLWLQDPYEALQLALEPDNIHPVDVALVNGEVFANLATAGEPAVWQCICWHIFLFGLWASLQCARLLRNAAAYCPNAGCQWVRSQLMIYYIIVIKIIYYYNKDNNIYFMNSVALVHT